MITRTHFGKSHFGRYALAASLLASGLLAGARTAQAQPFPAKPSVTTTAYPGADGSMLASGFSINTGAAASDNTLTFTTASGGDFSRLDAQSGLSAFAPGTKLIETFDGSNADGPLTISFSKAVGSFGLDAQNYYLDKEKFTFSLFNGATNLGTFSTAQIDNTSAPGKFVFLGASNALGITSVVISSTSVIPANGSTIGTNDFNVGPVTFKNLAPVPEASTYASFGLLFGLGGLGLAARRRGSRRDLLAEKRL